MSDVENAMKRWWREGKPWLSKHLMKGLRVGSLDIGAAKALTQCAGEAFRAGWKACEEMLRTAGGQAPLGIVAQPQLSYPRTHEILSRDITKDPIFLFQCRDVDYSAACAHGDLDWDSDTGTLHDLSGTEVSDDRAIADGMAVERWETITVFLTREEGEAWGRARAYNYTKGWRVFCVHATGDLSAVLATATEGGRYR